MSAHPIPAVQSVSEKVGDHMTAILGYFKPGGKITILVRRPEVPDHSQDFMLTNDSLPEAVAAIQRRMDPNKTLTGNT